jgi:YHS domain-containing protein
MEALLYLALWVGLIFLMMRFGCGAHAPGQGSGHHGPGDREPRAADRSALRWVPPAKDIDPVCGRTVETAKAKPSVYDGNVYYFCSRECREVFEAAPDQYLGGDKPRTPELEHFHA